MLFPASRRLALSPKWTRDILWRRARAVPSLDLRFADNKSLVDATTGQNLVTFTRASSGTYVDSQGVIRTATTNLLLRSEEFDNASWTVVGTAGVTANADTAPNGATSAERITFAAASYIRQFVGTVIPGATYTVSLWVKKPATGGASAIRITSNNVNAWNTGFSQKFTLTSQWQRIAATGTLVSSSTSAYVIFGTKTEADANDADCVGDVLVWGAQLEQSSTVGEYIPTTSTINSAPRFDHAPTTGESLGLLVEESRTNLLLQSNGFDTTWTNSNSSETAAAGTAPDGTNTAWELKDTLDTVATAHALAQTASFTSGTSYTLSCWIKAGTLNEAGFTFPSSAFTTAINCRVNLTTGAVLFSSAAVTTSTTLFANGWVRVVATATATATATSATLNIRPMNGAASYIGTGTGTILIWGAQLEAGAFPTSYIPTTTATVTRSADVASITGTGFSSWYRQDEGTVFSEFSAATYSTASYAISDGTNSNRIMVDRGSTGTRYVITNAGVAQSGGAQTPYTLNSFAKTSLGYALDNCNLAVGGVLQTLDTSATIPSTVDRLLLGVNAGGSGYGNGPIKRFIFWPRRLSDPTLQGITQ